MSITSGKVCFLRGKLFLFVEYQLLAFGIDLRCSRQCMLFRDFSNGVISLCGDLREAVQKRYFGGVVCRFDVFIGLLGGGFIIYKRVICVERRSLWIELDFYLVLTAFEKVVELPLSQSSSLKSPLIVFGINLVLKFVPFFQQDFLLDDNGLTFTFQLDALVDGGIEEKFLSDAQILNSHKLAEKRCFLVYFVGPFLQRTSQFLVFLQFLVGQIKMLLCRFQCCRVDECLVAGLLVFLLELLHLFGVSAKRLAYFKYFLANLDQGRDGRSCNGKSKRGLQCWANQFTAGENALELAGHFDADCVQQKFSCNMRLLLGLLDAVESFL